MVEQSSLFGSDEKAPDPKKASQISAKESSQGGASMPLAARMRPRSLDEVIGQEQLLGPGKLLRRIIASDRITSMILWGPPGSGKTTLAEVIAHHSHARFVTLSAVSAGVADLRKVVDEAAKLRQ